MPRRATYGNGLNDRGEQKGAVQVPNIMHAHGHDKFAARSPGETQAEPRLNMPMKETKGSAVAPDSYDDHAYTYYYVILPSAFHDHSDQYSTRPYEYP